MTVSQFTDRIEAMLTPYVGSYAATCLAMRITQMLPDVTGHYFYTEATNKTADSYK